MRRALNELNLSRLFRLQPDAFLHHFFCHCVLVLVCLFRQVHEGRFLYLKILYRVENLLAVERVESSNQALDEMDLSIFPELSDQEFADPARLPGMYPPRKNLSS